MPDAAMAPADSARPWLVLDTATATTQVGVWQAGQWQALQRQDALALETLPGLTTQVLEQANAGRADLGAIVFNAGPGSILGLRVALMFASGLARALSPSQPVPLGIYHGLKLHVLQPGFTGTAITPFRRDLDNTAQVDDAGEIQLGLHPRDEIAQLTHPLAFVPLRQQDVAPTEATTTQPHDLQALTTRCTTWAEWVQWKSTPDVYVPQVAHFKKWAATPHRKP